MAIDQKYCSRSLAVLTPDEILAETILSKTKVTLEIFTEDYELIKELNINLSRIIRFLLHDFLDRKVTFPSSEE